MVYKVLYMSGYNCCLSVVDIAVYDEENVLASSDLSQIVLLSGIVSDFR